MTLIVRAALVANAAAPSLLVLYTYVKAALVDPMDPFGSDWTDTLTPIVVFVVMSWVGMAVSFFPLTLIFALVGKAASWRSWWIYTMAGAAFGIGATPWVFPWIHHSPAESPEYYLVHILIGAICGWIYWRIALHQPPKNDAVRRLEAK
jgi:hypothetical protein